MPRLEQAASMGSNGIRRGWRENKVLNCRMEVMNLSRQLVERWIARSETNGCQTDVSMRVDREGKRNPLEVLELMPLAQGRPSPLPRCVVQRGSRLANAGGQSERCASGPILVPPAQSSNRASLASSWASGRAPLLASHMHHHSDQTDSLRLPRCF